MNDYELFTIESSDKQLHIELDGGIEYTNNELYQEGFELNESLCSDSQLRFGSCEASSIKFVVAYSDVSTEGKSAHVDITVDDHNPFEIGTYKVFSDKPSADRNKREIIAYDVMYDIIHADVTDWYNSLFPNDDSTITLKNFRDSFFTHVGVQQETVTLPNDDFVITKTLNKKQVSGGDIAYVICCANGGFGHINRQNVFQYIFLEAPSSPLFPSLDLFPSYSLFPKSGGNPIEIGIEKELINEKSVIYPNNALYPSDETYPTNYIYQKIRGVYRKAEYEEYYTKQITGLKIRNEKNEEIISVGVTSGDKCNVYYIDDNFLFYGKTAQELSQVAQNILDKIKNIYYCPSDIDATGNPALPVGTPVYVNTRHATIETIILRRRMVGIQSLRDDYSASGEEYINQNLNSAEKQLGQVSGEVSQVKSDLIQAEKVIAQEIEADRARISTIESDYIKTAQLQAVDAKIDNLSAIAITTQNLSAQSINGNQITAGTITADRLSASSLASSSLTVNVMTLIQTLHCQFNSGTNYGLNFIEVSDPDDLIGARVAYFYPE